MKSGNPVLRTDTFEAVPAGERMTINGTINKTAMMLALVMITAIYTWGRFYRDQGSRVDHAAGLDGRHRRVRCSASSPYSRRSGFPSRRLSTRCSRVCWSAACLRFSMSPIPASSCRPFCLTFGVMAVMLFAYRSGLIQATEKFKVGVIAATGGIALLYLISLGLSMFGKPIGFIHEGGTFGILFSGFVVVIAALNLILDFDIIKQGVDRGAPKHMEWYGAFALTVTLVWLYLEILRLLGKLRK